MNSIHRSYVPNRCFSSSSAQKETYLVLVVHGIGSDKKNQASYKKNLYKTIDELEGHSPHLDYDIDIRVIDWKSKLTEISGQKLDSITPAEIETQIKVRQQVNFSVIDVIYFQGQMYRDSILEDALSDLKKEYNAVVEEAKQGKRIFNGKVCLVGHSLGSVVCYNLLRQNQKPEFKIPFDIEHLFLWGSPVGLFASANSPFIEEMPAVKDNNFYNVFHPMDPVAYRIEPLIEGHPAGQKRTLPLEVPFYRNDGVAPHTVFKDWFEQTWDGIFPFEKFDLEQDRSHLVNDETTHKVDESERRFDFSLQEALIEELGGPLWWLRVHSIYWTSKDTVKFMLSKIAGEE